MKKPSEDVTRLLPGEKRALLKQLLEAEVEDEERAPLSFGQERLWVLDQLRLANPSYRLCRAVRLKGPFSASVAGGIFDEIVRRHEILRTTFPSSGGTPVQRIGPIHKVDLPVDDLSEISIGDREAALRRRLRDEFNKPFDLARGPLIRIRLIHLAPEETVLLIIAHHIICDGWSMGVVVGELLALYEAFTSGQASPLSPLAIQYRDFARSQRLLLRGRQLEELQAYWRRQLDGLSVLQLPESLTRPSIRSYRGATHRFTVSGELYEALKELSRKEGVTLFTVLLAGFKCLLFRYTGQEDIALRSPVTGRNRPELEEMIGFFVNTLVLRTELSANSSFRSVLARVREVVLAALEHQDFPFEQLVRELRPERQDPSRPPLAQVGFVFGHSTKVPSRVFGLEIEPLEVDPGTSTLDLSLFIWPGRQLSCSIEYSTDLFDNQFISHLGQHFLNLLQGIVTDPNQRVSDLPLLTESEGHRMLVEWGQGRIEERIDTCIQEEFEEQQRRSPEALAVTFEANSLTYRQLNRRANQLAHHLRKLGVGSNVLVGICLERSLDLVVALLAVLKAGGAYLFLEPGYPRERLFTMIEDSRPHLVLTQQTLHEGLFEESEVAYRTPELNDKQETAWYKSQFICLDGIRGELHRESVADLTVEPDASDLAYVIYTSGSTGRPKGVMVPYRALTNHMLWMRRTFPLDAGDAVLQKTPFGFDASIWEFLAPLISGARLVLARPGGHQDLTYLVQLIQEQEITTLQMVPSLLQLLLQGPGLKACSSLRRVFCGGEVLSSGLRREFFEQSSAELINLYGPAEACIDATFYRCPREQQDRNASLGTPIDNVQLYVLDQKMCPVPVGVVGEIHIGGSGLARGYLNLAEQTFTKFVTNPFSDNPDERLYKTGDLARYRPDGTLEFLGRLDAQLKINGVRIEPADIESVLRQHPSVETSAVSAVGGDGSSKRLVAYLVPSKEQCPEASELREFLRQKLPGFMVPSAFVVLSQLPLTANGKLDYRSLPAPEPAQSEPETPFVAPRDETEEFLSEIWAKVLGLDQVSVFDNFFDLGGASLQIIQVAAQANQKGYPLTPELLFEFQTIAELATVVSGNLVTGGAGLQGAEPAVPPLDQFLSEGADELLPRSVPRIRQDQPKTVIESLGIYLPPKEVSTEEVVRGCKSRIRLPLQRLTGINSRRMAGEVEFSIDLAKKAVAECLARSKYRPADIDLLICCNISRYDGPLQVSCEPSTAIKLKNHFGFDQAVTFDVTNACAGLFTGIYIADSLIKQDSCKRCMVVSGEYITHLTETAQREITDFLDSRLACLTLGDAGAALILEKSPDGQAGFHAIEMYTLGKFSSLCVAKASDQEHGGTIMYTDMIQVTATATRQALMHAAHVLRRSGWPLEEFDHLIAHQTSRNALRGAATEINRLLRREACHEGNIIDNLTDRGNTATTSHFVAVWDNILKRRIKSQDNALFNITGSGQTIGTALYTFDDLPDRLSRLESSKQMAAKVMVPARDSSVFSQGPGRVQIESVGRVNGDHEFNRDALELARLAAEDCLGRSSYCREEIEMLIHSGIYRNDFLSEPAMAALLAGELKINDDIESPEERKTFAFDIFNGPLGVLNSCFIAAQMIQGGRSQTALLVASEIENNAELPGKPLLGLKETGSALILARSANQTSGFGAFIFKDFTQHLQAFDTYATWDPSRDTQ